MEDNMKKDKNNEKTEMKKGTTRFDRAFDPEVSIEIMKNELEVLRNSRETVEGTLSFEKKWIFSPLVVTVLTLSAVYLLMKGFNIGNVMTTTNITSRALIMAVVSVSSVPLSSLLCVANYLNYKTDKKQKQQLDKAIVSLEKDLTETKEAVQTERKASQTEAMHSETKDQIKALKEYREYVSATKDTTHRTEPLEEKGPTLVKRK